MPNPPDYRQMMNQQWPPAPQPMPPQYQQPQPIQPLQPQQLPQGMVPPPPPEAPVMLPQRQPQVDRSHRGTRLGRVAGADATPRAIANSNRKQTKVWTDHNGCQYRICDIDDQMLAGIIRMMKRAGCVLRTFKLVELLGDRPTEIIGQNDTLTGIAASKWEDHVPMPEMFASMRADWYRRGFNDAHWDIEIANDSDVTHTFGDQVSKMIERLSQPAAVVELQARAIRSINI